MAEERIKVNDKSTPDELRRAADQREQELRTAQEYPKWLYHKSKPAVLVQSPEDEKGLTGYGDTPHEDNLPRVPGTPIEVDPKATAEADLAERKAQGEQANKEAARITLEARKADKEANERAAKTAKAQAKPKAKAKKAAAKKAGAKKAKAAKKK